MLKLTFPLFSWVSKYQQCEVVVVYVIVVKLLLFFSLHVGVAAVPNNEPFIFFSCFLPGIV